ncbi:carbohydrate ABC transporter permease [Bacillus sp. Marseille-P3661]|uniref:carbohydrate ABC transporter permease n=1 Tax=Bacillus sp. Marseille-P3661 TaxID=1936234 RepID=UPI000C864A4B|nr:carbohydrate ABC transporter permease [Bacillus sp. Marseille-P3661]
MNKLFNYFIMLFVVLISVVPLLWVLLSSFKTNYEVLESAFSWPSNFSFESYVDAIRLTNLHNFFLNSLLVAVITTIVSLIIFSMAGYILARFEFKFRNLIYIVLSFSILIPTNSMLQPIYILINEMNLYDTKTGLIFVYTGLALPIALFLLRSYFKSIPKEMEESAYIEGAGFVKTFLLIILPMARPALASAGVLIFLSCWNEFLFALLLTSSPESRTLSLALNYLVQAFGSDYPALFATIIMIILPSIVVYIILQEQISSSLASGAVKD